MTIITPASGRRAIYPKSDGWYDMDDAGVETPLKSNPGQYLILTNDTGLDSTTSANETILKTVTIPANTLGVGSHLSIKAIVEGTSTSGSYYFKIRIGGIAGTIVAECSGSPTGRTWTIEVNLSNKNARNVQRGTYELVTSSTPGVATLSTAIDFAVEQTLVLTGQAGANQVANALYLFAGYVA